MDQNFQNEPFITPNKQQDQEQKSPQLPEIRSGSMILSLKQDIFKKYKKDKMIGSGSYGQVFKCTHNQTGQIRAIKVLDKKRTRAPEKGYVQEVDNVRKLDHPNILKVYEVAEDTSNLYVVTELSEGIKHYGLDGIGIELFDEIHRRITLKQPFTEKQVASLIRQILSAISYAHSNNIIHRDIKPENILVEPEKNDDLHILVIDWGLSKDISLTQSVRQRIGTVDYAAPEVLQSKAYDGKCDVWSCGVILYILLSGETPFPGRTTGEIERLIVSAEFRLNQKVWKSISTEAIHLLKQMLQFNPKERISASDALQHPWFNLQNKVDSQPFSGVIQSRLQNYCCKSKLIQVTTHFLVSQTLDKSKQQELRQTFKALDTNGDGRLSMNEFLQGMDNKLEEQQVKEIFDRVDTDKSGYIDYTEFLAASVNRKRMAEKEKIKEAFSLFDQDDNGFIELTELREILAPSSLEIDEEVWLKLLNEIDENNDGKISLEEFQLTIEKFVNDASTSVLSSQEDYEPAPRKQIKLSQQKSSQIKLSSQKSSQIKEKNASTKREHSSQKKINTSQIFKSTQKQEQRTKYNLRQR